MKPEKIKRSPRASRCFWWLIKSFICQDWHIHEYHLGMSRDNLSPSMRESIDRTKHFSPSMDLLLIHTQSECVRKNKKISARLSNDYDFMFIIFMAPKCLITKNFHFIFPSWLNEKWLRVRSTWGVCGLWLAKWITKQPCKLERRMICCSLFLSFGLHGLTKKHFWIFT